MAIAQHYLSSSCGKPALFYYLAVDARIKFNTHRFADHKVQVAGLLKRVSTVSGGVPATEPGWRW